MLPRLVFKYKSIATIDRLAWTIDTIKNNRLFFPDRTRLNDPLEGQAVDLCPSYAGCSMYSVNDLEDPYVKEELNQYSILSLSSDGFSPQLWAHYGDIYSGICFCYRTDKTFKGIKKVNYLAGPKDSIGVSNDFPDCEDFFLYKQMGWSYEAEWRIVQKFTEERKPTYFTYELDDLACIIVGERINPLIFEVLQKYIPAEVPILRAKPGYRTFRIIMIPIDYEYEYDGSEVTSIYDAEGLIDYLKKNRLR